MLTVNWISLAWRSRLTAHTAPAEAIVQVVLVDVRSSPANAGRLVRTVVFQGRAGHAGRLGEFSEICEIYFIFRVPLRLPLRSKK